MQYTFTIRSPQAVPCPASCSTSPTEAVCVIGIYCSWEGVSIYFHRWRLLGQVIFPVLLFPGWLTEHQWKYLPTDLGLGCFHLY